MFSRLCILIIITHCDLVVHYYAGSNMDLEEISGGEGSTCSEIVFHHSHHKPKVTAGVLREESLEILREYFGK